MKYLICLFIITLVSCATNVRMEEEGVQIVKELPENRRCVTVGTVEVKDMVESSAQKELKNSVEQFGGNYLIITNTRYTTTFVIHKAEGFKCN